MLPYRLRSVYPMRIFLFPHYDDEMFTWHHLRNSRSESDLFIFLTSENSDLQQRTRSQESRNLLASVGVTSNQIRELKIPVDSVSQQLTFGRQALQELLQPGCSLICPALEGGHPDHDAAFYISLRAKLQDSTIKLHIYPTYGALWKWSPLYRVGGSPRSFSWLKIVSDRSTHLSFTQAFSAIIRAFRAYASQFKSWFLLFLPWAWSRVFSRTEYLLEVTPSPAQMPEFPWTVEVPLYQRHGRTLASLCQLDYSQFKDLK